MTTETTKIVTAKKAPRKLGLKAPASASVSKGATPKVAAPKVERVAKPTVAMHKTQTAWTGASDLTNARMSRTPIDFGKFGALKDHALSDRDQKAIEAIRKEFGNKTFIRANYDAGIIRRLGERGVLAHVAGSTVDPNATFRLTSKGLGKAA